MLSVHRHYRSWNDRANEWRAGRWVQDLLSVNQLTSRLCVMLGEKQRFTSYGIHGIWIFQFCIRHHVLWTGQCIVTGKKDIPWWAMENALTPYRMQSYSSTINSILCYPLIWQQGCALYGVFSRLNFRMSTRGYGNERKPELLTSGDPNPPQPTRSAFPQCLATAVSCRHKPTNNLSDTTDSKLTKDADQGSLGWQNNCCTSYWKHTFNCIYYIGCWNDIINDQANSQLIVMIIPQRSLGWFADSGKTGIRSTHSGTCHSCSKAILSRTQLSQGEPLF